MTQISRERREELKRRAPTPEEVDALLSDSAWRERVEPRMENLLDRWDERARYVGYNQGGGKLKQCIAELRAIVDTGDEEGE